MDRVTVHVKPWLKVQLIVLTRINYSIIGYLGNKNMFLLIYSCK